MLTYESIKNHFADLVARGENAKSTATNYTNMVIMPDDTSKQFCLSKAFLIGFEMDYPNQTVNLRHIASVDR